MLLTVTFCSIFHIQALTPAVRACLTGTGSQLARFASVETALLSAAVESSMQTLLKHAHQAHFELQKAMRASAKLQESISTGTSKFSIYTMATGSIDDFHKGLQNRIGERADTDAGVMHLFSLLKDTALEFLCF